MLSIHTPRSANKAQWYINTIKGWVEKKIDENKIDKIKKENIKKDLPQILQGTPSELLVLSDTYNKLFPKKYNKKKKKFFWDRRIEHIFNYTSFRKKFGYELANELDVVCCPYCNRNYTTVHDTDKSGKPDKKKVFPEFDHFYPRTDHPILALSFYNLVPSCNICNSHFKGSQDPITLNLFHPYTSIKPNHFNFKFYPRNYLSLIGKGLSIDLDFSFNESKDVNEKVKNSIDFFDIKATYEKCHSALIKDIIDKRIAYGGTYLKQLQSTYNLDFNQSYRILFETDYEENEGLHKRPFSKLKRDIYDDFEMTKYSQ
ncbi:hypothetical protein A4D02_28485 [Niastella koreensis]|uniref:HNH domain-containing protein n=2 Tax=Niastella koreensis TaxID=354356 RepID=G8T8J1_NIAKG|nr:hypothetical protein [Niastella koreensis]AEW00163.1 hypothetical protein Niako_3875 [Niastella koreensis GR20-10]OQP49533.1 hypothetical protein A4D02_28485 [Niastella koreensis]